MSTHEPPGSLSLRELPLQKLGPYHRGIIRAIFRAYGGSTEQVGPELSALRFCSLSTALASAVQDGCTTKENAEIIQKYMAMEVEKMPVRSTEYITALASGYNAGIKYDVIAAYVGKTKRRVITDLYALRKGAATCHLFKGNEHYGKPKDSACVRVKGPVPEWEDLIKTPFTKEESADSPPPPSRPAAVPPPLSGEASKAPFAEGAGDVSQLEELINGGAAFLSALPHGDAPRVLPAKSPLPQQNYVTIAAGAMTVTISGGADITIHIKGGNNNV